MLKQIESKIENVDFLTLADYSKAELEALIDLAIYLKKLQKAGTEHHFLKGKTLAMIFEKSSMRTRVSFETAMFQLGGHAIFITEDEVGIGKRETIADSARVLSRFVDGIMIRTFGHNIVEEFSKYASVPIINGLTDDFHPTQVLADLITMKEKAKDLSNIKLAYVGDGNNMAHSLLIGCATMGIDCSIATPNGYEVKKEILNIIHQKAAYTGAKITYTNNPKEAIKNADFIYTDVWASMGDEDSAEQRKIDFKDFQVTKNLLEHAKDDYCFMHCLPAHRGEEVAANVIDGKHSIVFDQAENRLHAHKAILAALLSK